MGLFSRGYGIQFPISCNCLLGQFLQALLSSHMTLIIEYTLKVHGSIHPIASLNVMYIMLIVCAAQ